LKRIKEEEADLAETGKLKGKARVYNQLLRVFLDALQKEP